MRSACATSPGRSGRRGAGEWNESFSVCAPGQESFGGVSYRGSSTINGITTNDALSFPPEIAATSLMVFLSTTEKG